MGRDSVNNHPGGRPPACIDAFCGPGGLSLGLRRAGFRLAFAFDSDNPSVETYRRNLGEYYSRGAFAEASGSTRR